MWQSETLQGHSGSVSSAKFSPDGAQIVTASDDNTARIWDVSGLLSNASRAFAASKNDNFHYVPIKDEACAKVTRNHLIVSATDGDYEVRRYPLAELTDSDISAAPVLRSIGANPGDNVCEISKPGPIDKFLSALLPRSWWSGLDYE